MKRYIIIFLIVIFIFGLFYKENKYIIIDRNSNVDKVIDNLKINYPNIIKTPNDKIISNDKPSLKLNLKILLLKYNSVKLI